MIGVGVVGCGYWGPNLARNFAALEGCELRALCDRDPARLDAVGRLYPAARRYQDAQALIHAPDIDAVAICTPVRTHHPLALAALRAGRHALVEKPLAHSSAAAQELVELAERQGLTLQVDHTFAYSGAVQKIREILDRGDLGDLLYIDCVRVNLGLFQPDVNVVWDLATHDASIVLYLLGREPLWVSAIGTAHYGPFESHAYVTMKYDDALLVHLHVNWLAPVKVRSTLIGGSRRMIVYDDLSPTEPVRVYEKGVSLNGDAADRSHALVDYRIGDMFAPHIAKVEPLGRVCREFLASIAERRAPLTDGRAGLAVVRVLEAAQASILKEGERIHLAGSSAQAGAAAARARTQSM